MHRYLPPAALPTCAANCLIKSNSDTGCESVRSVERISTHKAAVQPSVVWSPQTATITTVQMLSKEAALDGEFWSQLQGFVHSCFSARPVNRIQAARPLSLLFGKMACHSRGKRIWGLFTRSLSSAQTSRCGRWRRMHPWGRGQERKKSEVRLGKYFLGHLSRGEQQEGLFD